MKSKNELENIKSYYFLQAMFAYPKKIKSLLIFKYNKKIQKRLNISINGYKEFSFIEIELIPMIFVFKENLLI